MKERKRSPSALNGYEQIALLKQPNPRAPTGLRNLCIIILMLKAGLRVNEVINLRRDDFDWDNRRLHVKSSGAASARVLKISSEELDLLRRWRDRLTVETPYFFTTLDGKQLKDRYIREMVKRMAKKAGLDKDVYPHLLRHTFAVDFIRETRDMNLLQRALGHRDPSATQNYTRLLLEELDMPHNGNREGERSGFPLIYENEPDDAVPDKYRQKNAAGHDGNKENNKQAAPGLLKDNHEKQLSVFNSKTEDSGPGEAAAVYNNKESMGDSEISLHKNGNLAGRSEQVKQEGHGEIPGEMCRVISGRIAGPAESQATRPGEQAREEEQTIKMETDGSERVRIPPLKCCRCNYILHFRENCPQCGASFESIIRHWRSQI